MVCRFLVHSKNTDNEVSTATGLKQALFVAAFQCCEQALRIEVSDNLYLIFIFTHHQFRFCTSTCFHIQRCHLCQYTTTCQASTGYQNIISGIQRRSLLQQTAPCNAATNVCVTLVVRQQLQITLRSYFGNSEMRIIFRIIQ